MNDKIPHSGYVKFESKLSMTDAEIILMGGLKPKSKFAWKESYQWLKIVGLTIALGVMIYQTWLLKLISEKL